VNGGFETGDFTGWTTFDSSNSPNGGTISITSDAFSGSFAGNINGSGGPNNPTIKNANVGVGVVNPFDTVNVSFDWKGETTAGGVVFAQLFSELSGGGVSAATWLIQPPTFPSADWQHFSQDVTLGSDVSGGITFELAAVCGADAGCVSNVFLDNLSITTSAVPVPAAAWLFGSGLLGLVGVARRKKALAA
jgi:hypothetical protein